MRDRASEIIHAIQLVRSQVRWKPGSAARHLLKCKLRGHLPADAKLADYEDKIRTILESDQALVYLYRHGDSSYVTVSVVLDNEVLGPEHWIAMFDLDGVMETAFVVDRPVRYLDQEAFELLGSMDEVLRW